MTHKYYDDTPSDESHIATPEMIAASIERDRKRKLKRKPKDKASEEDAKPESEPRLVEQEALPESFEAEQEVKRKAAEVEARREKSIKEKGYPPNGIEVLGTLQELSTTTETQTTENDAETLLKMRSVGCLVRLVFFRDTPPFKDAQIELTVRARGPGMGALLHGAKVLSVTTFPFNS